MVFVVHAIIFFFCLLLNATHKLFCLRSLFDSVLIFIKPFFVCVCGSDCECTAIAQCIHAYICTFNNLLKAFTGMEKWKQLFFNIQPFVYIVITAWGSFVTIIANKIFSNPFQLENKFFGYVIAYSTQRTPPPPKTSECRTSVYSHSPLSVFNRKYFQRIQMWNEVACCSFA